MLEVFDIVQKKRRLTSRLTRQIFRPSSRICVVGSIHILIHKAYSPDMGDRVREIDWFSSDLPYIPIAPLETKQRFA
jgi:hypothetical protein